MLADGYVLTGRDSTYIVQDEIGRGGSGVVYKLVDPKTGQLFAAKTLSFHRFSQKELKQRFRREIEIHQQLRHPNIIGIHEVIDDSSGCILITEYASGGSLYDCLSQARDEGLQLPVPTVVRWLWYIARALAYIHSSGLIHRDLTPRNVLFRKKDLPAVCDFGISRHV